MDNPLLGELSGSGAIALAAIGDLAEPGAPVVRT